MIHGNRIKYWTAVTLLGALAACSSGAGDGIAVVSVVQDLVVDPDGRTTRVVFSEDPGTLSTANFTASAGQSPVSFSKTTNVVEVVWSARVTRAHTIKVVSKSGVDNIPRAVSTTNSAPPTFVITSAEQDTSDAMLGGDTLTVTFSGARVVEADVVDPTSWTLAIASTPRSLTGSSFMFDKDTQVLSVTLGASANLHQNFTLAATSLLSVADVPLSVTPVAGVATGDAVALAAPTVDQRLAVDALGRVVDFTFAKPMDPVAAIVTARFSVNDHAGSSTLTLPTSILQVSATTLRATFSAPVVPGLDTISLNSIADYHGNTYSGTRAITNSSPAANAYSTVTATTVENIGGDSVVVVTDQAFDPDLAVDPSNWTLTVDGNGVDLEDQTLSYELSTRALTIDLDFDMVNGDAVVITAVGQTDVDGEAFNGAPVFAVNASGDATKPLLVSALQNRSVDPAGQTVDVTFSEDLDPAIAANPAFYAFSPAVGINTAALVDGAGRIVRVETADPIIPGDFTFSVVGLVADLAGETIDLGATTPVSITTTDMQDPAILGITSNAIEGADNDTVIVLFNDQMVETEVESAANWVVESPSGSAIDVSGCTITYSSGSATMVLDSGNLALKVGDSVRVVLNTMRDVGGRSISTTPASGMVIGEKTRPTAHTVWRDAVDTDELVLYFSEPCDELLDLYHVSTNPTGSRFAVRDDDGPQTLRGYPIFSQVLDGGLGVRLAYGFVVDLNDTLDVLGLTDLAGNVMFPVMGMDILNQNLAAPSQSGGGALTALEGENNDTVLVAFAQDMNPWKLLDLNQYTITVTGGGPALSLAAAKIKLNATNPTRLLLTLNSAVGGNVQFMDDYDIQLNVDPTNPLRTARGVAITGADVSTLTAIGDLREPLEVSSAAVTDPADANSLYVIFNEAVETSSVSTPTDYVFDGGTATGVAVTQISPRAIHVNFDNPVSAGANLVIAAGSTDLAGTATLAVMTLAVTDDVTAPLIGSVAPNAFEGTGNDTIVVTFNEVLDLATALDSDNYTITNGATVLDLGAAILRWSSVDTSVTIQLPSSIDLDVTQSLTVGVSDVEDLSGNAMGSVSLGAAILGDLTPATIESAFVNLRANSAGNVADVLFSEDVDSAFAGDPVNWTASGGQLVLAVQTIGARHYRISFVGPLGATDTLDITGVTDAAGNVSGALSIDPVQ